MSTFTDQVSTDQPYIVWDKPENSSVWTYTIYNLEQYAPNGKPYLYVVTEVIDESKLENTAYGQDICLSCTEHLLPFVNACFFLQPA